MAMRIGGMSTGSRIGKAPTPKSKPAAECSGGACAVPEVPAGQAIRAEDLEPYAVVAQKACDVGPPVEGNTMGNVGAQTRPSLPGLDGAVRTAPIGESSEQGWLRAINFTADDWLDASEDERRLRLDVAAKVGGTDLSTVRRERLLQSIDQFAAAATGREQPVYRGVPVEAPAEPAPQAQMSAPLPAAGNPYAVPSSGPYVPSGSALESAQNASPAKAILLGALILAGVGYATREAARKNPTKRSRKKATR